MRLKVGSEVASLTRRGTILCVRTGAAGASNEHVWMANLPDAETVAGELANTSVTSHELEARGFTAMK